MTKSTEIEFAEMMEKAETIKFCMLTTQGGLNRLRSRPFTTQQALSNGTVRFLTAHESDVVNEINASSAVALIYADTAAGRYLSMLGDAHISNDRDLIGRLWSPMNSALFSDGVDDSSIRVIEVNVFEAELWEPHGTRVGHLFTMAKAALGGDVEARELGRHVDVSNPNDSSKFGNA
jgi:general stress protein 26